MYRLRLSHGDTTFPKILVKLLLTFLFRSIPRRRIHTNEDPCRQEDEEHYSYKNEQRLCAICCRSHRIQDTGVELVVVFVSYDKVDVEVDEI